MGMHGQYPYLDSASQYVGAAVEPAVLVSEPRERSVAGTVSGIRSTDGTFEYRIVARRVAARYGCIEVRPTATSGRPFIGDDSSGGGLEEGGAS